MTVASVYEVLRCFPLCALVDVVPDGPDCTGRVSFAGIPLYENRCIACEQIADVASLLVTLGVVEDDPAPWAADAPMRSQIVHLRRGLFQPAVAVQQPGRVGTDHRRLEALRRAELASWRPSPNHGMIGGGMDHRRRLGRGADDDGSRRQRHDVAVRRAASLVH